MDDTKLAPGEGMTRYPGYRFRCRSCGFGTASPGGTVAVPNRWHEFPVVSEWCREEGRFLRAIPGPQARWGREHAWHRHAAFTRRREDCVACPSAARPRWTPTTG